MKKILYSYRTKLLASFLLCSLLPLLLCSVLLVYLTGSRLNRKEQESMDRQMESVIQSADLLSRELGTAGETLEESPGIRKVMNGYLPEDITVNSALYQATRSLQGCSSAFLCSPEGEVLYSTDNQVTSPELSPSWGILRAAKQAQGQPVFRIPQAYSDHTILQGAVSLTRKNGEIGAFLVVDMGEENFYHLFNGRHGLTDGLLIVNAFWRPVYASSPELAAHVAPMLRQQLFEGQLQEESGSLFEIRQHAPTGLWFILQKPQAFSRTTMEIMYAISIGCALLCVVISLALYFPMSKQISAPIQRLQKAFRKLGQADLQVQLPTDRQDELGQLARDFNKTVVALRENQQALLANEQELNQAQIRLLQTQLNPHFLCNTLDTMKWISKIHKVPEVAEMSADLADILRYCIKAEEFVPLYREVEFLQRYIEIQKIRMGDKVEFLADLPEELAECIVPKMILQPLVENAVIHGLPEREDGRILLTIRTVGKMLEIKVSDNGRGLPEELVGKPYERPPQSEGKHLGLYNVNTILKRHYGGDSGLYLDRGPEGVGTTVTAMLPIEREEEHHD